MHQPSVSYLGIFPFFLLSFLGFQIGYSQETVVSGRVFYENDPLIGIYVVNPDLSIGTMSDSTGYFEIELPWNGLHQLFFRFGGKDLDTLDVVIDNEETLDLGNIELQSAFGLDEVLIKGKLEQGGEEKARIMMMESSGITNIVGAEGIARLPDKNAAEALQRMSGVVMQSDQGEGRYISFPGNAY